MSFCRHVYENIGFDICPDCNEPTHETKWEEQHELHKEWISSGKAVYGDLKSTRLNSSHTDISRMPSSA